jgi:hypothetical protein
MCDQKELRPYRGFIPSNLVSHEWFGQKVQLMHTF